MTAHLFSPLTLAGIEAQNRVVLAPMCQYSADKNGNTSDWHLMHWGQYLLSEAGLLIMEATGVAPEGRITSACLGLWNDENEAAMAQTLARARKLSGKDTPVLLQLSHAGRKAASPVPFRDNDQGKTIVNDDWRVVGPSALPFAADWQVPHALTEAEIADLVQAFADAATRAIRAGFEGIEIHAAHGYLLSSFLSGIANQRTDGYGGSAEKRRRFPLEVFKAVRAAVPAKYPVGMRINGTDWAEEGVTPEEACDLARDLAALGCDFIDVSSGGNILTKIPVGPGYQLPFADAVRRASGIPTMAVGMIRSPLHAESILTSGQADMIALGRGFLNDPRWVWHAAEQLGVDLKVARQYAFGATSVYKPTRGR